MKKVMYMLFMVLLAAVSQAETIKVDDDATGGNSYGNTQGFAIDFDATAPLAATTVTTGWAPALVNGKSYALNSISIQYGGAVTSGTGICYLGVYSDMGTTFLGASTNAIDFNNAVTDGWYAFNFEGLNVTVDNVVGSGTGLLYFYYQPAQTSGASGEISTRRLQYDAAMTQGLCSIIAYNTLQGARVAEYIADIGNKDTVFMPHNPAVLPENADGSSGTLQPNKEDVQVTFTFDAAMDPNDENAVNPNLLGHNIYLWTGAATEPNVLNPAYLLEFVEHTNMGDPAVSYGPHLLVNAQGLEYKWAVEEVLDDGTGNPLPAGDPNNIMGNTWKFTAQSATPAITTQPVHTLTDAGGNAALTAVATTTTNFQWYQVVGVKDTDPLASGDSADTKLLNSSSLYEGTTSIVVGAEDASTSLSITSAASNGSNDARVYVVAYNGDPSDPASPKTSSNVVWFWYPRLMNHYTFETMTYDVDPNGITPDSGSAAFAMHMASNDTGVDFPVLDPNVVSGTITGTNSLKFNNPRGTDPNSADAQYAQIAGNWVGGYKDITISMWVYSKGGSAWNRLLDLGTGTTNNIFVCMNTGSVNRQLRLEVNVNGTVQNVTTANDAIPDYEWTFVSCTLSGNTGRIYVNGELAATNTSLSNDPVSFGPTTQNWLGRSQYGTGDGYFNGMIDELDIYNYARTTVQIAQDYVAVKGGWVCDLELTLLPYDLNDDCIVDIGDFALIASTWLDSHRID